MNSFTAQHTHTWVLLKGFADPSHSNSKIGYSNGKATINAYQHYLMCLKTKNQVQLSALTHSSSSTKWKAENTTSLGSMISSSKLLIQTFGHNINTLKPLYTNFC